MPQRFEGVIGRTVDESQEWWPEPLRAREGSPNVLVVLLDDVGYSQIGCFGGLCDTPNFDRLAQNGVRYRNFHTTALCSPTRACLLTGRNHHRSGMAAVVEIAAGYPGYNGIIPFENGFLSEILVQRGYAAWCVGKWHLTPQPEMNMAAPRERWPLGRGFERFYGFMGGETNQWEPDLVRDNQHVHPPRTAAEGYHLTEDLVDTAIEYVTDLRNVIPDKPFFLYLTPGACHSPHHVPPEWIERYRGRFDMGWDEYRIRVHERQLADQIIPPGTELTERPHWIPAWDSLSDDERTLYARMMEVYAAFLAHTDHHIGRLLDHLATIGDLDNTIVLLMSDNGASAEGGPHGTVNEGLFFNRIPETLEENLAAADLLGSPESYNHYPFGWAWAGNAPFRRWKREVHEGGVADPLVVHWPAGIASRGEIRGQYVHCIDILPTVLDILGIEPPGHIRGVTQSRIDGVSFAHTLDDPDAMSLHDTQYYEMLGNRGIYHKGWKAVTYHGTQGIVYDGVTDPSRHFDEDVWELYNVDDDFSESRDLASEHPQKLRELQDLFWAEAGRNNVLPLNAQLGRALRRPRLARNRHEFVYRPGGTTVEQAAAVNVMNRSHSIVAEVEIPDGGAEGVLLAHGGRFGGYALYVLDGRLRYTYNFLGRDRFTAVSTAEVTPGRHRLGFSFEKTGQEWFGAGGVGRLFVDGEPCGEVEVVRTAPFVFALAGGLECGRNTGNPVSDDYASPFAFTGTIERVVVDVSGPEIRDPDAEMRVVLARE